MRFWDSSGVVPLLLDEPTRVSLLERLGEDSEMFVWWGTTTECVSAIARQEREGSLDVAQATDALSRLRLLSEAWHEILPSDTLRTVAQRLLRVHPLRAADSLQLAAAIVAASGEPASLEFLSLDERLNVAAQREGFLVVTG